MPDAIDPAAYRDFVARAGLDPAIVREVEVKPVASHGYGPGIPLRVGESVRIPGHGKVRFLSEGYSGTPIVTKPETMVETAYQPTPRNAPELTPAPASPQEYWARVGALAAKVAAFRGRLQLAGGRENGWLSITERAVDAIIKVMGSEDVVEVAMEETFGQLSAVFRVSCTDATRRKFLHSIGDWAMAAATRRCMLFGTAGRYGPLRRGEPWAYTLSDEARSLGDPVAHQRIYPPPPAISQGGGDV